MQHPDRTVKSTHWVDGSLKSPENTMTFNITYMPIISSSTIQFYIFSYLSGISTINRLLWRKNVTGVYVKYKSRVANLVRLIHSSGNPYGTQSNFQGATYSIILNRHIEDSFPIKYTIWEIFLDALSPQKKLYHNFFPTQPICSLLILNPIC